MSPDLNIPGRVRQFTGCLDDLPADEGGMGPDLYPAIHTKALERRRLSLLDNAQDARRSGDHRSAATFKALAARCVEIAANNNGAPFDTRRSESLFANVPKGTSL